MPSRSPAIHPRLAILDVLRGLAALWVALYHFTQNGPFHAGFPADQPLKTMGTHGWLGVYVFFVISGFILPWTMDRSGYRLRDYGRFLWKRLLRLHPLYLLSVGAMLLPFLFHAGGTMAARTWADWWPHFFYLNGLLNRPWLMDIYWTLALEAQYYLAIGLLFPLLVHRRPTVRWTVMAALILLPLVVGYDHSPALPRTVPPFAAIFAMGMLTFWKISRRCGSAGFLLGLCACGLVTWRVIGGPHALIALLTAAAATVRLPRGPAWLMWLGSVSYPLYLCHLVIGGLLLPQLARLPRGPWLDGVAVVFLLAVSLVVAWGLHGLVELPAQRWSSAIRYRRS